MTQDGTQPKPDSDLMALARERDFDAIEAAWMDRLEAENPDLDELFHLARYLVRKRFDEEAGVLLWSLVAAVAERADAQSALAAARRAALTAPRDRTLREELVAHYRKAHAGALRLDDTLDHADLLQTGDIEAAVQRVEDFLHLQPGAYVAHRLSRRAGRVKGFEHDRYVIEASASEYRHAPADVLTYWEPLRRANFRALVAFERDHLRELARSDPERLIRLVLESHKGRIEFKHLKDALIPAVIPKDEWSAWWAAEKSNLKRSPWIEVSPGPQSRLTLRAEAAAYRERFLERVNAATDAMEKADLALEYVAEIRAGGESDPELARDLGAALVQSAASADAAQALAMLAAARALHQTVPETPDPSDDFARRLAQVRSGADLIAPITRDDTARLVIETVKAASPERWPELCAEAFPAASLRLCDWIARTLLKAGHQKLFLFAARQTAARPEDYPLAFGWVWRHLLRQAEPPAEDISPVSATVSLLHLMHRIERLPRHAQDRARMRRALGKLRSLVGANSCRLLKDLIIRSDTAAAVRLHRAVTECEALPAEVRDTLIETLNEAHPEQFIVEQNLWEDGQIYLTPEGYEKCHAALDKLVHEDMRRNAVAIGTAAAKGDLRENWEYKTALEERDRLVERAGRLREEFERARILRPDEITGEEVNVGTTAHLRDTASGHERTVTFLGPWDADIENGIYSYLAPLSLRFMGKRIGDRVLAALGDCEAEYEIAAIQKAI